eukprot:SAG31_NODE_398_length_16250_cov_8.737601_10_plen_154_part_00
MGRLVLPAIVHTWRSLSLSAGSSTPPAESENVSTSTWTLYAAAIRFVAVAASSWTRIPAQPSPVLGTAMTIRRTGKCAMDKLLPPSAPSILGSQPPPDGSGSTTTLTHGITPWPHRRRRQRGGGGATDDDGRRDAVDPQVEVLARPLRLRAQC